MRRAHVEREWSCKNGPSSTHRPFRPVLIPCGVRVPVCGVAYPRRGGSSGHDIAEGGEGCLALVSIDRVWQIGSSSATRFLPLSSSQSIKTIHAQSYLCTSTPGPSSTSRCSIPTPHSRSPRLQTLQHPATHSGQSRPPSPGRAHRYGGGGGGQQLRGRQRRCPLRGREGRAGGSGVGVA
jgi:hypothetical protein